ncbi:MAG TPA: wax ester/triacylglycerol synthase family O-acyltransferase [Aeromicrobium sp.]|nr:wax ester/triacylglycerol synthase family O-acyltransferase [Aeromicrobium sp.]
MGNRLSPLDNAFLQVEDAENRMQLAGMLLFRGEAPEFGEFRDAVADRLLGLPRFQQRLASSVFGLRRPKWVDDEAFALDYHVSRVALPAPGGQAEVAAHIDQLTSSPLDLHRPLWEVGLVEGLAEGFGISLKVHHCMADGLSIMDIFTALLAPDADLPTAKPRSAIVSPTSPLVRRISAPVTGLMTAAAMVRQAPPSPFNTGRSGPTRKTDYVTVSLDDVHRVRRAHGTTVNNAVLAVVSGGLRRYLERHDVEVDAMHAFVPVNRRSAGARGSLGNQIAMTYLALPVGELDPDMRVRKVVDAVRQATESGQAAVTSSVVSLLGFAPAPIARTLNRAMQFHAGLFNLTVTNVPGPAVPVHFLGRPLELIVGSTPLTRRHAVTIAVLSYNGTLTFMVTSDPSRVPDGTSLADDLEAELIDLGKGIASSGRTHE